MRALILYFQFFTQISINIPIDNYEEVYRKGIWLMGIFGGIYWCILWVAYYVVNIFFSTSISWIIILIIDAFLTGGFHQDALSDTVDGIFSSRKKEDMLRIMKDSRIGSNGAVSLIIFYLILYTSGVETLVSIDNKIYETIYFFLLTGISSRSAMALAHRHFQYSSYSKKGLGSMCKNISFKRILIAQSISLLVNTLFLGYRGIIVYVILMVFVEIYRARIYKLIDGMNGDTLGASCLLSQVLYITLLTSNYII